MSGLLWLEPTSNGTLPPTSLFFASGRTVLSTFVLGTLDPSRREHAYRRTIEVLMQRTRTLSLGDLKVRYTRLSKEILGSPFLPYSKSKLPGSLSSFTSFAEVLADEEALKGELEKQDKCKLIYQAVFGGEHMLSHIESAWKYFSSEWERLDANTNEALGERISPEGDLYRINLRPAKELGISQIELFDAIKRSAALISSELVSRKERILPQSRSIGIEPGEIITSEVPHHSPSYASRNRPAYRLLHVSEIAKLLGF